MAIGKTAGCLILAGAAWAGAADAQFPVRHRSFQHGCNGVLSVSAAGVSFSGPKWHTWTWKIQDIQELQLSPRSIHILTYGDRKLRLGAEERFEFTGTIPVGEVYAILKDRMDQRLVAEVGQAGNPPAVVLSLAVKHLGRLGGSQGTLAFAAESVVYSTAKYDDSRTWRYSDIETISSAGRFELTITTLEKEFHFQLKQPLAEAEYNRLWLEIEKKNGRIQ